MGVEMRSLIAAVILAVLASCGVHPAFAKGDGDFTIAAPDPATVFSPIGQLIDDAYQKSASSSSSPVDLTTKGFCTAFYIGGGKFLSAGHCLKDQSAKFNVIVSSPSGAIQTRAVETFLSSPPDGFNANDFAVIYVDPALTVDLKPLPLDCDYVPKVGDIVDVEGFPEDLGRISVEGRVAATKEVKWAIWSKPLIRLQVPISYGNSGSPVMFGDKVIGIAVGVLPNNRTLSTAQPITAYCDAFVK